MLFLSLLFGEVHEWVYSSQLGELNLGQLCTKKQKEQIHQEIFTHF